MTHKSRMNLSAAALLSKVKALFQKLPGQVKGNREKPVTLTDCLMSVIAIFGIKYSSLLAFNKAFKRDPIVLHNLQSLYYVKSVPSDTYMRERLMNFCLGMKISMIMIHCTCML